MLPSSTQTWISFLSGRERPIFLLIDDESRLRILMSSPPWEMLWPGKALKKGTLKAGGGCGNYGERMDIVIIWSKDRYLPLFTKIVDG